MKKIFIRSPYFIEVDEVGQVGSKVELRFYNKGESVPTDPTYTLSKVIASDSQTNTIYNISNYAKDFIKPINPVAVLLPTIEDVNTWCFVQVKRYKETAIGVYTLLDTETIVCLNGYSQYSDGYNYSTTDPIVPLFNTDITKYTDGTLNYVNVWFDTDDVCLWESFENFSFDCGDEQLWKLPFSSTSILYYTVSTTLIFTLNAVEVCEPIYTPLICNFINSFGGWEFLTFFKASSNAIATTSKDFNLLPTNINYNPLQGQKQVFNKQGKQTIKCNTGWVNENYSELIQDLLLSEVVLLDGKPAIVKSQGFDVKTKLKENNINYEIDFEFNYGLINNVI